jgi:hypothetical protein
MTENKIARSRQCLDCFLVDLLEPMGRRGRGGRGSTVFGDVGQTAEPIEP